MDIMNCFMNDMMERIALEASTLVKYRKRATMTSNDIQASV